MVSTRVPMPAPDVMTGTVAPVSPSMPTEVCKTKQKHRQEPNAPDRKQKNIGHALFTS